MKSDGQPTHECPADGCTRRVPMDMLMCYQDWKRVPKPLQRAVWRAWDHGNGSGSPEHVAAIRAAVVAVNRAG